MSDILGAVKGLFTQVQYNKVYADNFVFRLHYKVTAILLLVFGILVTSRQYIGDPIDCITDEKADKIVDQFCWSHGTYTQLVITEKNQFGYEKVATREDSLNYLQYLKAHGKGSENPSLTREFFNYKAGDVESRVYHTYYQWVWCILFLQAFLFYVPHWLWKTWEGGRLRTFVADLNTFLISPEEKQRHQDDVVDYFCHQGHGRWTLFCWTPKGNHTGYALKYFFCEILNFVNICAQLLVLDVFFNYEFSSYGLNLWRMTDARPYARHDHFTKVFPIVTMCELPIIGYGGTIVGHQAVCVLPINVLNEKIFIFMWCWFLLILVLSTLGLCYRLLTFFPSTRIRKWLLLRLNHAMSETTVDAICRQVDVGDWYFLYLLGKNMNPIYFAELIQSLGRRFQGHAPNSWDDDSMKKRPLQGA